MRKVNDSVGSYVVRNKTFLLSLLVAFVFLTLWEPFTSPFNPCYWNDSSIFSLIGRGMSQGLVPYKDLFDHKGPLLFAYYALGYWIYDGKGGVFIPQLISLSIAILLAYRISRLYLTRQNAVVAVFCMLFTAGGMVCEGGLSEEWSLPFSFYVIYAILKTVRENRDCYSLSWPVAFAIGVSCGCHGLLRLNNISPCIFPIVFFLGGCLWQHRYMHCLSRAVLMLLGFCAAFAPFFIWFMHRDALSDFIEGAFIMNFRYALSGQQAKTLFEWLYYMPQALIGIPVVCFVSILLVKEKCLTKAESCVIVGCIALAGASATLGYSYMHYFLVYLPGLFLCFVLLLKLYEKNAKRWHALAVGIAIVVSSRYYIDNSLGSMVRTGAVYMGKKYKAQVNCAREIIADIPQEEKGDVFVLNERPYYYLYNDSLPTFKYFTYQSWHGKANPEIIENTIEFINVRKPKWLIMSHLMTEDSEDPIESVAYGSYKYCKSCKSEMGNFYLYQRQ